MAKGKNLIFITDSFPFGSGESFIGEELPFLAKEFEQVYIFPDYIKKEDVARDIPQNCKIVRDLSDKKVHSPTVSIKDLPLKLKMLWWEFKCSKFSWFRKNKAELFRLANKGIYEGTIIQEWINKNLSSSVTLYSFWFSNPATACAVVKLKAGVEKWVSSIHGYDLYDERHPLGRQPFQELKIHVCEDGFLDSQAAEKYLRNKNPSKTHCKINHRYLGVQMPDSLTPISEGEIFTIASCSNVIPLKRLHLIVKILEKITFPIRWIHVGSGELMNEIQLQCDKLPSNVKVELLGRVPVVNEVYLTNSINLFLHLSETEGGAPVAVMDGLSCGIPVLGCDAGGVSEMITEDTGKLLPIDFDIDEAVSYINEVYSKKVNFYPATIKEFCAQKFNAPINYTKFAKKIRS